MPRYQKRTRTLYPTSLRLDIKLYDRLEHYRNNIFDLSLTRMIEHVLTEWVKQMDVKLDQVRGEKTRRDIAPRLTVDFIPPTDFIPLDTLEDLDEKKQTFVPDRRLGTRNEQGNTPDRQRIEYLPGGNSDASEEREAKTSDRSQHPGRDESRKTPETGSGDSVGDGSPEWPTW